MDEVAAEVGAWEGVAASRAGAAVELRYDGRPLGTVLPGRVEVAFHPRLAAMLVETGRAEAAGAAGLVVLPVGDEAGAAEAVELFRLAYERARVAERVRRTGRPSASGPR